VALGTHIVWYRRDLRLDDHPALRAATGGGGPVVPLFVLDPRLVGAETMSPARLSYLADALHDLDAGLRARGGRLIVRHGDPREVVPAVAAEVGATAVHVSRDVTPFAQARDAAVGARLEAGGVAVGAHPGILIRDPGTATSGDGSTYRVYSPFRRAWARLPLEPAAPAPGAVAVPAAVASEDLPTAASLGAAGRVPPGTITGGETAAQARLARFLDEAAQRYHEQRDLLGEPGTSRLSADLHYGTVSPRAAYLRLDQRLPGHESFAGELIWRDFYGHVLARWPEIRDTEFNPELRDLPWRGEGPAFDAWREGRTGYPIIDAAQRQLRQEGWMHNRARMVSASFLCKDLLVDWRLGQDHFLRHLVDGDIASNNGGWQWAAGTGTDAQPYFRIFNPVTQGEKFDPQGRYVRHYVPELAAVPDRWVHHPWDMPAAVARDAGVVVGEDYPAPIVDHADARRAALAFFRRE